MRVIPLKKIENFDYRDILRLIVGSAQAAPSMNIEQVRRSVAILDALDSAEEELRLDERDWQYVCQRVKDAQWQVATKEIIGFVDAVELAKEE